MLISCNSCWWTFFPLGYSETDSTAAHLKNNEWEKAHSWNKCVSTAILIIELPSSTSGSLCRSQEKWREATILWVSSCTLQIKSKASVFMYVAHFVWKPLSLVTSIDLILIPTVFQKAWPKFSNQRWLHCVSHRTVSVLPFYLLQSTSESSPDQQARY